MLSQKCVQYFIKNDRTLLPKTNSRKTQWNLQQKCLHAGYTPKNGEPRVQPIVQSTTFTYDSAEEIGKLFDLQAAGYFYTRLSNPTTNAAEEKITALEGGVATMCTASGQAAVFYAMLNILQAGDHFISSSYVYGGSYNLFAHTFKKMGIEVTFVDQDLPLEELKKSYSPKYESHFCRNYCQSRITRVGY